MEQSGVRAENLEVRLAIRVFKTTIKKTTIVNPPHSLIEHITYWVIFYIFILGGGWKCPAMSV